MALPKRNIPEGGRDPARQPSSQPPDKVEPNWLLFFGSLYIGLGLAAMILPRMATITVSLLLGLFLVLSGFLQLVQTFKISRFQNQAVSMTISAVYLASGGFFLFNTTQGAATLTFFLGVLFMFIGVLRFLYALRLKRPQNRWMLAGAVASALLGSSILLAFGLTGARLWILGFLIGVDLLFIGLNSLYWGYFLKRDLSESLPRDRAEGTPRDPFRPAS